MQQDYQCTITMYSVLSIVLCALCTIGHSQAETVFGAASSGQYWGANIFTDGQAATVKFPLYPGFSKVTGAVAVDAVSGQGLFEHFDPHSITYGPMCSDSPGIVPKPLFNITDVLLEDKELGEGFSGKAKAFAIHDSKIYFLYYAIFDGDSMTHKFQVRVLQSCEECGVDPYEEGKHGSLSLLFTVNCSTVVAEKQIEAITDDEILTEYHLGNVLKVVGDPESDKLDFYFQVGELNMQEPMSILIHLYHADSMGSWKLEHKEPVDNRYSAWDLKVIGAVDYLDGLLCWTALDRVLCRYGGEVHRVLGPADALAKGICTGSDAQHLNDISGVAIVKGSGDRVVLFGCSPQTPEITGAGIIKIAGDNSVTISALKAEEELLSAASLVTVKKLPTSCSFDPAPILCVRLQQPTTTDTPPTSTVDIVDPEIERPDTDEPKTEPEVDNEPSGEPEDNVIGDNGKNEPVSGSDDNGGASTLSSQTRFALHLLTVLAVGWLLS